MEVGRSNVEKTYLTLLETELMLFDLCCFVLVPVCLLLGFFFGSNEFATVFRFTFKGDVKAGRCRRMLIRVGAAIETEKKRWQTKV